MSKILNELVEQLKILNFLKYAEVTIDIATSENINFNYGQKLIDEIAEKCNFDIKFTVNK